MNRFTEYGAEILSREFTALCKKFAEDHDLVFDGSRLTYGQSLSFNVKFGIEENKNEAWESMVRYFAQQGVRLAAGMTFYDGNSSYTITGELNPSSKSKYRIGIMNKKGETRYGTVEWVLNSLK